MNFADLILALKQDTLNSLALFSPELCLAVTIVVLLFVRLFGLDRHLPGSIVAMIGTVAGLALAGLQWWDFHGKDAVTPTAMFTGLLIYDPFTVFFRIFLLLFLLFVEYLTMISGIPDQEDAPDFYVLLLGSTLGMAMMASANHLLMVFLAVEMTSVPSYAMVGFLKGRRLSSEASLKYVVYGAGAAGVMLYGISLLAGLLGTAHLPAMGAALVEFGKQHSSLADPAVATLAFGILMILVGVAFKLSAFPFHFWCPDAFEGAPAEVGGFLSVASKGAAFALLVRFLMSLVGHSAGQAQLSHLYLNVGIGLGVIAAITTTFGNLAAYTQKNIKRMLAYSTIAHAGYMLMAPAAMMVILNSAGGAESAAARSQAASTCVQGLLYYLVVYFFMNLSVFAVVALVRNQTFSEEIEDYSGLVRQSPLVAVCLFISLFSLVGMPPMGGFVGKVMVFYGVLEAAQLHPAMWFVFVLGLMNTAFSLFYYLRVLRNVFISPLPEGARPVELPLSSDGGRYMALATVPVLLLGIFVDPISSVARDVATWLFQG